MKSKLTRILAVILAFGMLICCFSACGGKEDEEESTKPTVLGPTDDLSGWATDDTAGDAFGDNLNSDALGNSGDSSWTGSTGGNTSGNGSTGGSYWPSGSTSTVTPNYPSGNGSSGNNTSGGSDPLDTLEDEVTHFFTHFDTPEERAAVLKLAGYEYDAAQGIFYTHLNPWQRYFGFTPIYDQAAPLTNMWYLTLKMDFLYGDFIWRLQWWKGQYGVLEGAELGVYTKYPEDDGEFFKCAADEQLLRMTFDYYHSLGDYNRGNILFTRAEQEHWWLTGFKFGVVSPTKNVVRASLYAYDDEMADKIELCLQNVKDANGNINGFTKWYQGTTDMNFYIRTGNKFSVVWLDAGYLNYNTAPENPEEENPDVDIPEESSSESAQ